MTRDEILKAIKGFFSVLEDPMSASEREAALCAALDRLGLAYHFAATPSDDQEYPEPPQADYQSLRARTAALFPEFGYYNVASKIGGNVGEATGVVVADASDDLADIASDLHEVLWRWEARSARLRIIAAPGCGHNPYPRHGAVHALRPVPV